MRLISIDIGIKHLAYCYFKIGPPIEILDWKVIDLSSAEQFDPIIIMCQCQQKNKKPCISIAEYSYISKKDGPESFFCKRHAKKYADENDLFLPEKMGEKALRKMTKVQLISLIGDDENRLMPKKVASKEDWIQYLLSLNEHKTMKLLKGSSFTNNREDEKKKREESEMIVYGVHLRDYFDKVFDLSLDDHMVVIENQIAPHFKKNSNSRMGTSKMKMIQGMVAQYFLVKNKNTSVSFISSTQKLAQFTLNVKKKNMIGWWEMLCPGITEIDILKNNEEKKENIELEKKEYRNHKKNANHYCCYFLENMLPSPMINIDQVYWHAHWINSGSKKDDLSDSFLQGMYVIHGRLT